MKAPEYRDGVKNRAEMKFIKLGDTDLYACCAGHDRERVSRSFTIILYIFKLNGKYNEKFEKILLKVIRK